DDHAALIGLALDYTESRHRLGLLGDDLRARIVRARGAIMAAAPAELRAAIEFYDPERFCAAAPLRDNLLFGRIDETTAGAAERVLATLQRVLRDSGLETDVYRLGLDQQTGPGGRFLSPAQRSAIGFARCLIKRPDVLILDRSASALADAEG